MPSSFALAADMTTTAAPPSEICEALPAVMVPSLVKAGFSAPSDSAVVPGPHPLVRVDEERVALALGHLHRDDLLGQAARPWRRTAAFSWLAAAKASWRSREIPTFSLCCSVESPMAMWSKESVRPSYIMESTSVASPMRKPARAPGRR